MSIFTILRFISKDNFRILYIGLIAISVLALAVAYYVEYIMQVAPCPLCVYQRFPYLYLIKLSLAGLLIKKISRYSLSFITITLFTASLLAGYHTGVERKIFEPSAFCSSLIRIPDHLSISDIKKMLYNQPVVSCINPALKILGLSMTEWNLLLNLVLLLVVLFAWINSKKYN